MAWDRASSRRRTKGVHARAHLPALRLARVALPCGLLPRSLGVLEELLGACLDASQLVDASMQLRGELRRLVLALEGLREG